MESVSRGESLLRQWLSMSFEGYEALYNYRELGIINDKTGHPLEIDIYYPELKLAYEFQGEGHYNETAYANTEIVEEVIRRDELKRKFCENNGITLFQVKAADLMVAANKLIPKVEKRWENSKAAREERKQQYSKLRAACFYYRRDLKKIQGHKSHHSDAKNWRDEMKAKGYKIPSYPARKTVITEEHKKHFFAGKYGPIT